MSCYKSKGSNYEKEILSINFCWIIFGELLTSCGITHVCGVSHILEGNRNCPVAD